MNYSRRKFIRRSSAAMAGAAVAGALPSQAFSILPAGVSPSDKVRFGVIGCNGMGWSNMRAHLTMDEVDCIALCDVDSNVLDRRTKDVDKMRGNKPTNYKDYRKLLENPDIDAVIIGTPDHWHCRMMVDALDAGKHVYVEKPAANSIAECKAMMKAAAGSSKLVQVGQWQRSGTHYASAIDYVQSGKLGNIRLVKVWAYQGWMKPVDVKPDSAAPKGVDYEMWLGPAKKRAFNPNRFHFNFRWFWDYAGGLMTDWGVHEIDIALFAMKAKAPKSVMASGGKLAYPDDASETPDTLQTVFEYEDFNMLWEHATGIDGGNYGRTEGIAFIGNNGTLVLNRGGWEVIPETSRNGDERKEKVERVELQKREGNYLQFHARNFVDSMNANDASMLKCGINSGCVAAINAHMGNIAYHTGRKIYWDAAQEAFKNDDEANRYLVPEYHNGWVMPTV